MPSKSMPDRFLSFAEVAEMIGLAVETVKKGKAQTNELPRVKLGSRVVFSLNAVQAWIARKAEEAQADQRRERSTVIDLFDRRRSRRQSIKDKARRMANEEKRRWKSEP